MPPLSLLQKAQRHLARRDAILKTVVQRVGPCTLQYGGEPFGLLARAIVAQQISTRAAMSISARLLEMLGSLTPLALLKASEETLRAVGLSTAKRRSLLDLATQVQSGSVRLNELQDMTDEEAIAHLIPVRGIGRWTAEMFLIFGLGRLDVLPVGDFGLRAGVQRLYQLADLPAREQLETITAPWQPYRSIGTWYIWRSAGPVPQS